MIRCWILCILVFTNHPTFSQSDLNQKIDRILSDEAFEYASVGLSVKSLDGKEVLNVNADRKLIPASSLKLITTFIALEEFGETYTFTTRVGYTGKLDRAGTLDGNLVIIGSGDPTFGSARYGSDNSWDNVLLKIIDSIIFMVRPFAHPGRIPILPITMGVVPGD